MYEMRIWRRLLPVETSAKGSEMHHKDINCSNAGYGVELIAGGVISVVGIFLQKAREKQEEIAGKKARKREMENELYRNTVDNLPIDLKFALRAPRR